MLLKHYLDQGVSKSELARRFGINRATIHHWVKTGQLDRDLLAGPRGYSPRPPVAHKLDPYKPIIDARLEEFPKLSAKRLFVAALHRHSEIVAAILKARADVRIGGPGGKTPADVARMTWGAVTAALKKKESAFVIGLIDGLTGGQVAWEQRLLMEKGNFGIALGARRWSWFPRAGS